MVIKDLLPSLEAETQALLLTCFTITAVPAYFIRRGRKLVEEEAAQQPYSKAASPSGQGLGRRSPGSSYFLPFFTNCVEGDFCELRLLGILGSSY
jgi:hypothetical protein